MMFQPQAMNQEHQEHVNQIYRVVVMQKNQPVEATSVYDGFLAEKVQETGVIQNNNRVHNNLHDNLYGTATTLFWVALVAQLVIAIGISCCCSGLARKTPANYRVYLYV